MNQSEQKDFIKNIEYNINKKVVNDYVEKLKTAYINYDKKEYIHRLFLCILNLYTAEDYKLDIDSVVEDVTKVSVSNNSISIDRLQDIQMMCINKLLNDYLNMKYDICKTFHLKSMKTMIYPGGHYNYGPLCLYFSNDGSGYHGSSADEDSYSLKAGLNHSNIMNDKIYDIKIRKIEDIYDYLLNVSNIEDIESLQKEIIEFNKNSEILKIRINELIKKINQEYCLNITE